MGETLWRRAGGVPEVQDPGAWHVRRIRSAEWRRLREVWLAALADTPIAFLETHREAAAAPGRRWIEQARLGAVGGERAIFVAVAAPWGRDGAWVGMAGGRNTGLAAELIAVWVAPDQRGRGVADDLVDAVAGWAREHGCRRLDLWVHETNGRARSFYRRRGFRETDARMPYPLPAGGDELRMSGVLQRAARASAGSASI